MPPADAAYRPRIYIHSPSKLDMAQLQVKISALEIIRRMGMDPQEFAASGIVKGDAWTFDRAIEVMRQCDGALILALRRFVDFDGIKETPIPSEYSHFEGALALSFDLPTLVIAEEGMPMRGILSQLGGSYVLLVPKERSPEWVENRQLRSQPAFQSWVEKVQTRSDVFFGYCSKANALAKNLKRYLTDEAGLRVLDWATDFRPGRTIMEEIARATATCRCGLFLFTTDDPIEGMPTKTAVPRDNVLLEAGYFMSAHSASRVVVVREEGTKMPADLGGMIYLTIDNRDDWRGTAEEVAQSIHRQMKEDS